MELTEEQRARLPKGVQSYIADLERTIAQLTKQVALAKEGPADSDTIADPGADMYRKGDVPRPLPRGTEVKFILGPGWGEQYEVQIKTKENGMRVLEVRGDRRTAMRTTSSNVVHFFSLPMEDV